MEENPLIGPFQLIEEVGRGGMGTVWRAARVDGGFAQTVAIKLINRGMDTNEVIRRFTQERQILSLLNHPNIARLLDGGSAEDGRPYLVMEYIAGQPLLAYCKEKGLRERLELFRTICGAVQHAHSHLVIHRDLKPSNVMVRETGEVKLLDFGIAKVLEAGGNATMTRVGPLTPAYASPEQHEGKALTTASDVYSLGLMLGELAPGQRAADLQAIVEKATRTEPERRYATAEQLAEDVNRYMRGQPVEARAGAFSYKAAKLLSRYAVPALGGLGLLAAALGGLAYVAVQKRSIELERDRAEEVSGFLRELFGAADPERNQGNRVTTRQLLDLGAARARSLGNDSTRQALLETMAEAYFNLGLYEKATGAYRELLALEERSAKPSQERLARGLSMVAEAEEYLGRHKEAETAGTAAVALAMGVDERTRALVWMHRCNQLRQASRAAEAVAACQEAAKGTAMGAGDRGAVAVSLGSALLDASKYGEAEAAYQEALRLAKSPSARAQALSSLGRLYFRQGRFPDAEKTFVEAIAVKRRLYPDGHLDLAQSLNNLANVQTTLHRGEEAIATFLEAHGQYRKSLGEESSELASSLSNLAIAYSVNGQLDAAAKIAAEVVGMQARTIGEGKMPHISAQMKYGAILLEQGKAREGVSILEAALGALERLEPAPKLQLGYTRVLLAQGMLDLGRRERAEILAREAQGLLRPVVRADHWMIQQNDIVLGGALARGGSAGEGRKILAPVLASFEAKKAKGWWAELARRYGREAGAYP
ncbi:MAG: serine/threonine protein kinase [Bryobacterales bacterium]|nr:serine/threonine protein kinase [Bryobacterales bacterium]